ncbi:SPOR domain-containing protein [Granulicella paludicola]|uniref:SPOR domain-containing protein n=1 Tax=Granulicella paludicola TaxID=474951 RepID=UPI0021E0B786|nr:SPOR domain-containing protein [Granulicella paludicola]
MSYLREQDDLRNPRENEMAAQKEHELTLSTTAIFGIFFGQVVLCAIFFGFGYSLGGHRSTGALPSGDATAASNANFGSFKPAAGTTAGTVSARPAVVAAPATADAPEETPAPQPVAIPASESKPAPAPIVRSAPVAVEAPKPVAAAAPTTGYLVQVAAISINHPDDATMLQNALRAKGYSVSVHPGPDQFIHLLLGPFNERSAAEAMRQRLLTDGYTAYIK